MKRYNFITVDDVLHSVWAMDLIQAERFLAGRIGNLTAWQARLFTITKNLNPYLVL